MIKVLIVDDSAIVRAMIKQIMETDIRFQIVGIAENGEKAVLRNTELNPDLIVMDINMPVMDGLAATKKIMETSDPAVVCFSTEDSVDIGYQCIEAGALELIRKPDFSVMTTEVLQDFCERLVEIADKHAKNRRDKAQNQTKQEEKVSAAKEEIPASENTNHRYELCLIGASTGGPAAVQTVLTGLGSNFPLPILVTQHIDSLFDVQFAKWLDGSTGMEVELAENGTIVKPGHAYVSPANVHLEVEEVPGKAGEYQLLLSDEPPLHFLKPAVDKLFFSASKVCKEKTLAIILTGMGRDGADGCKQIVDGGGMTIAQDENSCIVFGMPRAAIECGGVKAVKALDDIAPYVKTLVGAR